MDEGKQPEPVWCGVANVVLEREYGPGGAEKRSGTKHFPAGAKVYAVSFFWGMGGEQVTVLGRHRDNHRFVTMIVRTANLANWRTELVYSPYLAEQILAHGEYDKAEPGSETARRRAEHIVALWQNAGAKTQPFTTRLPPAEGEPPAN